MCVVPTIRDEAFLLDHNVYQGVVGIQIFVLMS